MTKARLGLAHALLLALAAALAVAAADVLSPADPPERVAVTVAISVGFIVGGVVASARRPQNGLGRLLALLGFSLLLRKFQYGDTGDWMFTAGYLVRDLPWVVFGHIVLSYPSGKLHGPLERAAAVLAYATALALPLAALLVHEPHAGDGVAAESAIAVAADADAFDALRDAEAIVVYGAFPLALLTLLAIKVARASRRGRRMYLPLFVFGVILALRGIVEAIFSFTEESEQTEEVLFWTGQAMEAALGVAVVISVFRVIRARATLADALADLHDVSAAGVRDGLARALRDPELEVAFWVPERRAYVDAAGRAVSLSADDPRRSITAIRDSEGEPIAALVHDSALENEPSLVRDAAAAARLALENARLQAELRAQLQRVQESRRRIVTAADDERRRIERDLHDGAQQRLVALALELRSAQRRLRDSSPEAERVLGEAVEELQAAVAELRELAHGVHPSVLTQNGLASALETLAARSPVPVRVSGVPDERLEPDLEATAYFVVCEALANAVKHSGASAVTVDAARRNGRLVVAVADDGVGGADPGGSGLRGLADRVEAHGGSLRVESEPGRGTRVIGELPCAS